MQAQTKLYILRRNKISFSLLSICEDELMPTPKIFTFLPTSSPTEKNPFLSNPMPYPECLYRSTLTCCVNLTAPNKQFSSVG